MISARIVRWVAPGAFCALAAIGARAQTAPAAPAPAETPQPQLESMTLVEPGESPAPSPDPTPAPTPAGSPRDAARSTAPVTAEDILREFQQERPVAEPLLPRDQQGERSVLEPLSDESASSGGARLPDGHILVDRTGRLLREGNWWVIAFIADNHPDAAPEPPMKLLPNRMLERMVRESESAGATVEFVVSGEVTDFLGENYLLLRKLMRKRDLGNLTR